MSFKIDGIYDYIDSGDMSAAIIGDPINLASHMGIALQCIYTGTPDGILKVEASCDMTNYGGQVINWTEIGSATLSTAGSKIFNCRSIYYKWIRIVYTPSIGSGVLTVNYTVKGEW